MFLDIELFRPETIKPHRIMFFIGPRGTGKTDISFDILYHLRSRFHFGCSMCPTLETNLRLLDGVIPSAWMYDQGYSEDQLQKLLGICKGLKKRRKNPNALNYMDDCMADKKIFNKPLMRDIFMNGRHFGLTMMIAMQYLMDIPIELRSQVDYLFLMRDDSHVNREKLWKYYFGMFRKFEDFNAVFEKCTENFGALVLDKTIPTSNKLSNRLFWYRGLPEAQLPRFRLFKPTFWRLNKQYAIRETDDSDGFLRPIVDHRKAQNPDGTERRAPHVTRDTLKKNRDTRIEGVTLKEGRCQMQGPHPHPHPQPHPQQWVARQPVAMRRPCAVQFANTGMMGHPYGYGYGPSQTQPASNCFWVGAGG